MDRSSAPALLLASLLALVVLLAVQSSHAVAEGASWLEPTNIHGIYRVSGAVRPVLASPLGSSGVAYAVAGSLRIAGPWPGEYLFRGSPTLMHGYGRTFVLGTSFGDLYVYNGTSRTLSLVSTLRGSVVDAYIDQDKGVVAAMDSRGIIYLYRLGVEGRFEAGEAGQEGTRILLDLLAGDAMFNASVRLSLGAVLRGVEGISLTQIRMPIRYSDLAVVGEDSSHLTAIAKVQVNVSSDDGYRLVEAYSLIVLDASATPSPPRLVYAAVLPYGASLLDSAIVGGQLYVLLSSGDMVYLYTGVNLVGNYFLGERPVSAVLLPTVHGVRIHVSTWSGNLYVFSSSLRLLRATPVAEEPLRLLRLPGLIVGYDSGRLYCFDPDGGPLWNGLEGVPLGAIAGASSDPVGGAIAIYGDDLYYSPSPSQQLSRLDIEVRIPSEIPVSAVSIKTPEGETVATGSSVFYVKPYFHYVAVTWSPVLGEISSGTFRMQAGGMKILLEPPVAEPIIRVRSSGDPLNVTEGPIVGAQVTLTLQEMPGVSYTGYADEQGIVHLEVPGYGETRYVRGGTYKLVVKAEGFRDLTRYIRLEPSENGTTVQLDIAMDPILGSLHLILRDLVREVRAQGTFTMLIQWSTGEAELEVGSSVSLTLPPGSYRLTISGEYYEPLTTEVRVPGDHVLVLRPLLRQIHVFVSDTFGRSVAGSTLMFSDPYGYMVKATTDETGTATVELPLPGPYTVSAEAEGYLKASAELDPQTTRELAVVLQPVTYEVVVLPKDPYTGKIVPAQVKVTSSYLSLDTVAGERVTLPVGAYNITIIADGYKTYSGILTVNMSGEYFYTLQRTEHLLDLVIVGYRGKPVEATVALEPLEPVTTVQPLRVKGELTVVLTRSTYKLRVEARGYEALEQTVILINDTKLTIKLQPTLATLVLENLTYIVILAILAGIGYGAYRMYRIYLEKRRRKAEKEEEEELELPEFRF